MRIAYQYRLKLTKEQRAKIDNWLGASRFCSEHKYSSSVLSNQS
ncbi:MULTISPECIES: helix-turn-helix domain-containing protein [unclassified Moorena]|nr:MULTISPECIES: helix-turn-helix domain-containing protein [unclassified Moorena]